ncbi:MAG: DUF2116 family Zn-ribbon domain-containing protein [Candidatus Methanofastidiosia archaeon]
MQLSVQPAHSDDANPYKCAFETVSGDDMAIQQHKHCIICEKAIPADEKFCSDRCEGLYEERRKKARRTQWLFYGSFAVIIGWFLIMAFTQGG